MGAVLLAGWAIGLVWLYVYRIERQAAFIVRTTSELLEQTNTPTLRELQERYGNKLQPLDACTALKCEYTVLLSNRLLAALRIVPYTELKSYFRVRNEIVLSNMLDYTTLVNHQYSVVSHIQTDFCNTCRVFAIDPWIDSAPSNSNGLVEIGNQMPGKRRYAIFALDLRCLAKRGCTTVADLLPTVWRRTADNKIACRFHTEEGWIEKPMGWP